MLQSPPTSVSAAAAAVSSQPAAVLPPGHPHPHLGHPDAAAASAIAAHQAAALHAAIAAQQQQQQQHEPFGNSPSPNPHQTQLHVAGGTGGGGFPPPHHPQGGPPPPQGAPMGFAPPHPHHPGGAPMEPPRPRFMFKMPRVVANQKEKFETDDLMKRHSREAEVRYTAFRDRPLQERQAKFITALREGHTDIAFIATGFNLVLSFSPIPGFDPRYRQMDFEKEPGRVHLNCPVILNGVCVRWKGYIDLERLDGVGCLEFDEESAKVEDVILREQVEAYNRRMKEFEEYRKAQQRHIAAFMGQHHALQQAAAAAAAAQQLPSTAPAAPSATVLPSVLSDREDEAAAASEADQVPSNNGQIHAEVVDIEEDTSQVLKASGLSPALEEDGGGGGKGKGLLELPTPISSQ